MSSNQFQKEYIEYLEKTNEKLLEKLTLLRKNYDDKILSKDLSKHCILNALEDVVGVCSALSLEVDLFFDKMTSAMELFKNLLVKKSDMVQMIDKISKTVNLKNFNTNFLLEDTNFLREPNSGIRTGKRAIKVSPMIDGHVILTEPRIFLNRITENLLPKRESPIQLSPVVEVSPEANLDSFDSERSNLKECQIALEGTDVNNFSHFFVNKDSPKSRFSKPKKWKKSFPKSPSVQTKNQTNESNCSDPAKERAESRVTDDDPLEGPSWMYCENDKSQPSPLNSLNCFVDFRRRKNRFSIIVNKEKDSEKQDSQTPKKSLNFTRSSLRTSNDINSSSSSSLKCTRKVNNSSRDIIGESLNNEQDANISFKKRKSSSSRICLNESQDENDFENFERNIKKNTSTPAMKLTVKSSPNRSRASRSYEENLSVKKKRNKLYRRSSKLEYYDDALVDGSTKSTSNTSKKSFTSGREESGSAVFNKTNGRKSNSLPLKKKKAGHKKKSKRLSSEKNVKSDSKLTVDATPKKSKKSSPRGRFKAEAKLLEIESNSRPSNSSDSNGRKKRKAAPVNFCEPSLRVKLRRNF